MVELVLEEGLARDSGVRGGVDLLPVFEGSGVVLEVEDQGE